MKSDIVAVDPEKCIGCSKCIKVCPVDTANIVSLRPGTTDSFVVTVDPEKCINCGECIKECRHDARIYNDSIDEFIEAINEKKEIAVIVAPSVKTAFSGNKWRSILYWIKTHGNVKIYDVSFGADICTWAYNKAIKSGVIRKCISQPCPSVVNYIEMHKPELIHELSPVHSPASCEAIYLKKYIGLNIPIFLLSPCIAKSSEAEQRKTFNYNVTFKNLETFFINKSISFDTTLSEAFEFDLQPGVLGQLYSRPGGLKDNLLTLNNNLVIRTSAGPQTVYKRIDRYLEVVPDMRPDVLDVLHCENGCNIGTATACDSTIAQIEGAMDALELAAQKSRGWWLGKDRQYKEFDKKLEIKDFMCTYQNRSKPMKKLVYSDIEKIFADMLKDTKDSQEIDCECCGYQTCYQMCEAIYNGLNVKENCIHYIKNRIKLDNEKLNNLCETMNSETQKLETITDCIKEIVRKVQLSMKSIFEVSDSSAKISGSMINILTSFSMYFSEITIEHIESTDIENVINVTEKISNLLDSFKSNLSFNKSESTEVGEELDKMTEQIVNLKILLADVRAAIPEK